MLWPCFDHGPCKVVISSLDPSKIISKQKKKSANDPHHFRKRKSPNVPGLWFVNHFPPVRPSPLSARKANWGLDVAWPWVLGWPVQVQYKSNKSQECKSVKFILEWIRYPYIYIYPSHIPGSLWNCFEILQRYGSKRLQTSIHLWIRYKSSKWVTAEQRLRMKTIDCDCICRNNDSHIEHNIFLIFGHGSKYVKIIQNEATIVSIHVSRLFSRGTFTKKTYVPTHAIHSNCNRFVAGLPRRDKSSVENPLILRAGLASEARWWRNSNLLPGLNLKQLQWASKSWRTAGNCEIQCIYVTMYTYYMNLYDYMCTCTKLCITTIYPLLIPETKALWRLVLAAMFS